jgi:DNA polymerase-1
MKKSEANKKLVLLDVHAIMHRAYHALPDFATSKGEPTGALYGLVTMLTKIIDELNPDYIAACYDLPKPTYRHEAYKEYKAGRAKTDGDLVDQIIRSRDVFKAFNIPMYEKEGFEADDMLGTIVEIMKNDKDVDIVIASGDMDTLQLVSQKKVQVYTLKKGIKDTIIYDEKAVEERFGFGPLLLPDYKGLRGDPSDNIIGISGIGEKTATDLIHNFGTIENIYDVLKKDKACLAKGKLKEAGVKDRIIGLLESGEEEAKFSKMLATIRRDAPITFELPKETWKECFDFDKTDELFTALEFRNLSSRLRKTMGAPVKLFSTEEDSSEEVDVSSQEFKEASLALWVLDSNITSPKPEDIFNHTHAKSLDEAKKLLLADIEKKNLNKVYEEIELPLIPVVDSMEKWGIKIDKEYLETLSKKYHIELDNLKKEIIEMAGMDFNVSSPKQLGEVLFEKMGLKVKNQKKTASGSFSTKESELEKLKDLHPIIGKILEYREFDKLLGTYIDTIPKLLDTNDRLHTTLMQAGTTTGRMSSHNPNIQNIPMRSELGKNIRRAFIAEKGFKIVSFDYSQIELRIAAFLSQDEKLLDIFRSKTDVHKAVAAQVFKVEEKDVTSEMRGRAKTINFGILFGMGVTALQTNLKCTRAEAQQFLNDYFETFTRLAQYLDRVKSEAGRNAYTTTYFGRRRYFEGLKSKIPYVKAMAERMAINAPIQGTEADIIKLAMINIHKWIEKEKLGNDVRLLLQVHDELVFEIKEGLVEKVVPKIKESMEGVEIPEDKDKIVCVAESEAGENWLEMSEVR